LTDISDLHPGLKHLFDKLSEEVDDHKMTDLKKIIAEVRPTHSKWASGQRKGQEILYSHFEKVLNTLKNILMLIPFYAPLAPPGLDNGSKTMGRGTSLFNVYKKFDEMVENKEEDSNTSTFGF
jgi:hypothetical protein